MKTYDTSDAQYVHIGLFILWSIKARPGSIHVMGRIEYKGILDRHWTDASVRINDKDAAFVIIPCGVGGRERKGLG